jgi:hypothetical protein
MVNTKDVLFYIEKYDKKLKSHFFEDWDLNRFPFLLLMPDGSFSTYGVKPNVIEVGPTSGNLKMIVSIYEGMAKHVGIGKIRTFTIRNPVAYAKLSGATLVDSIKIDGQPTEYVFELEVINGEK